MYELKKIERCLRENLLRPGHRLVKKEFTGRVPTKDEKNSIMGSHVTYIKI